MVVRSDINDHVSECNADDNDILDNDDVELVTPICLQHTDLDVSIRHRIHTL